MRCSKCILPDTIPGIYFNHNNECNYCMSNYPSYFPKGDENLYQLLQSNIRKGSSADCLVGLSGGKDSTYSLAILKNKFNMRVEAFTYIHEGSTSFSIENAINICKKLNIKHHIVSLAKQLHLKTFTGFFTAWLKSPSTTTAGMTCVACKHLHLLGMNIAQERNIPMIVWSNTPLEYAPFLALKYTGNRKKQYKRENNLKGSILLLKEFFKTKDFSKTFFKYFDTCINGCMAAFPTSSYLKSKFPKITPVFFYEYHNWIPGEIKGYIIKHADWKFSDNKEDWHSDCLFNYFKEYMFLFMLGASYTDAFLSNQIRYNLLSREESLNKLLESRNNNSIGIIKALEYFDLQYLQNKIDINIFSNSAI
jgi:glutamine---fructose-6-phosphate transaminase (isomerizing)